jgi:hypothetical protein
MSQQQPPWGTYPYPPQTPGQPQATPPQYAPPGAQPYPYPYQPQPYPPYGQYPQMAAAPPEKQWPVPKGKIVPTVWFITLIVGTLVAVGLAFAGSYTITPAPAAFGTVIYQSSLASDDGKWTKHTDNNQQCAFTNGGLDTQANQNALAAPQCELTNVTVNDFQLRVQVAPQNALNNAISPLIVVRTSVAFIFEDTGNFTAYDISGNSSAIPVVVFTGSNNQWHGDASQSNTIVIQAQGATYTVAENGATIYSGDFNGKAERLSANGAVGLGAAATAATGGTAEALYMNFSLATP